MYMVSLGFIAQRADGRNVRITVKDHLVCKETYDAAQEGRVEKVVYLLDAPNVIQLEKQLEQMSLGCEMGMSFIPIIWGSVIGLCGALLVSFSDIPHSSPGLAAVLVWCSIMGLACRQMRKG